MHVWALGLSCVKPRRLRGRRGVTRQPDNSKRAHLSAPALQTPPKFNEKTPREGRQKRILRREKDEILGPHRSGPHNFGAIFFWVWPHTVWGPTITPKKDWPKIGLARIGLAKIGFGQNWPGQNHDGQKWIGQNWSNQDGQNGIGQSRSLPMCRQAYSGQKVFQAYSGQSYLGRPP